MFLKFRILAQLMSSWWYLWLGLYDYQATEIYERIVDACRIRNRLFRILSRDQSAYNFLPEFNASNSEQWSLRFDSSKFMEEILSW